MAARPRPADVVRMARALARGSAIDAPRGVLRVIGEFRGDTPSDSPLTLERLMARDDYRDLMTPKVAVGEPALDFALPRHDFGRDGPTATGEVVRLSAFRRVQPVALIFGSYT